MTYFKDIGKGCKSFFNLSNAADGSDTDYQLGETWSISVNQGAQTIEGKRNGSDGYLKYTQKSFLPEKPFKKLGGTLEVKLVTNDTAKSSNKGKPATAYELALKKLSVGGASIDLEFDGGKLKEEAWKIKAKYGKREDINVYAELKGESLAWKINGTYTKNDYVAGLQVSGAGKTNKGYGLAAQWTRAEYNSKLSLELEGKDGPPNTLTAKLQKQVSNDFSAYLMGKVDAAKGEHIFTGDISNASNQIWLGGDFNFNDSSSLQLSVLGESDGKGPGGLRAVYTHKLGDNLTGSLSFDTGAETDSPSTVFSDGRIGWKLAFA